MRVWVSEERWERERGGGWSQELLLLLLLLEVSVLGAGAVHKYSTHVA